MQQDELDTMLSRRAGAAKARPDLAERIIHAALADLPNRQKIQTFWQEVFSMLVIPHPSVAVATGIVLGVVMGFQASDGLTILQQDWSSFLYVNEGGWL